mmetsp:Transcript_37786/g.55660  ORF Transcript_37786/g.55660 Transcript_37786/m.55660 type:complete len:155 (-) Transcript_37786:31-495(-)|eukprot:CAMPEP_0195508972 /NCGR_PEP_ID=MMETSP0794_2-20130614/2046_1 /TAXON_ID=515487 /ORGANISM="Stephanopyxis turris, Strain CCMP 815" /LENGTH=154 /DNA_ID=CAMNT_0040636077 /DNA_START=64 /DNA_END=528 /DNA_ORIENTATION=-
MASPALESTVKALNSKMEGEAKMAIDEIDRLSLRPIARESYACVVKCYDVAGKNGSSEQLQRCAQQCQAKYQHSQNMVNQEVQQFQNRLNRAMMQCNDEAGDLMTPDTMNNPKKRKIFEQQVGSCFTNCVNTHIGLLDGLKKKINAQLKEINNK